MNRARPLPASLGEGPFATARAIEEGVPSRRLRAKDLTHPFHGVNANGLLSRHNELCAAYALRMRPGQAFSHITAARLYGWPLPLMRERDDLHVSVLAPRTAPHARGVRGHSLRRMDAVELDGLPVCSPVQTWCQLGTVIAREELVAVGDHLLGARRRRELVGLDDLVQGLQIHGSARGAGACRWALPRLRWGADSRPESLLRLAVVDAGWPEPVVNPPIQVSAGLVLHPDLAVECARIALEYEGDGHRSNDRQWHDDIVRRDHFETAGWRVIRVTRHDLFRDRAPFFARANAVLDRLAPNVRSERS